MNDFAQNLPAGLADPLHILPPWSTIALTAALILLVVAILIWAVAFFLSRRQPEGKFISEIAEPYRDGSISGKISKIRDEYTGSRDYRQGCHALSAVMKSHIEKRSGLDIEEMTPDEITVSLKGNAGLYFEDLSELQFRKKNPLKREFVKACETSKKVAKNRHMPRKI